MSGKVRKFVSRAPRLDLSPTDSRDMYFALDSDRGQKVQTQVANISASGMAFHADRDDAPSVGEMIKVEFTIPKHGKLAWFARVMRVEIYDDTRWWEVEDEFAEPTQVIIGVKYIDLPEQHKEAIQDGLEQRFREIRQQRLIDSTKNFSWFVSQNFWNLVLFGLCITATVLMMYLLALQPPIGAEGEPFFEPDNNSWFYYILRGWKFW